MTEKHIYKEKDFLIAPAEMWQKWTTHTGLKTFFGVANKVELKIGGDFEIYFMLDAPTGSQGSEGCKILSFLPQKMLSFSWNAPPHLAEVRRSTHHTCVVIFFDELENKGTRIRLYHHDWKTGGEWDECFTYFEKAWEIVLESLAKAIG